jgi:AcrR family transcriptional regulator
MADAHPVPARGTKRLRTRALLVEAAARVIASKGFEGTSLEAVAAEAGMTRGAIYGNFSNKEALFLAVVATKWQPILPPFKPGASFAEQMSALADAVVASLPARRGVAVGAASFQLYALKHAAMREHIAGANAAIYRDMAAGLKATFADTELPMAAEVFVRVAHATIDGLMFLHALTPDLIDAEVVRAAIKALGGSGDVPRTRDPTSASGVVAKLAEPNSDVAGRRKARKRFKHEAQKAHEEERTNSPGYR